MSKKLVATYEMIRGYKHKPSNYCLAIGEFIDNSISNYQKKDDTNPIDGLKVHIIFNFEDKKNSRILISDNANGMSAIDMEEAMQPSDRKGKKDTDYNQYGVGMKLGIFWFGEDVTIYSKLHNEDEYKLELNTSNRGHGTEVEVESNKSRDRVIQYKSGTTIIINKIYANRNITIENNSLNKFKHALGWRYNKLIEKGLEIRISVMSDNLNKNSDDIIEPFFNRPFQKEQLFSNKKLKSKIRKDKENKFNKLIHDLYNDIPKLKESNKIDSELLMEAYHKLVNNEKMEFKKYICVNDQYPELNFAIFDFDKNNKGLYTGVTIYHKERAIMHGPNDDKSYNFYFINRNKGSGGDPKWRWLYGDLNLTGIEVPDENKYRFDWSPHGEENLKEAFEKIYYSLEPILKIIVDVEQLKENNKPNWKEAQEIAHGFKNSFKNSFIKSVNIIENNNGELGPSANCIIGDEEYKIEIFETEDDINFMQVVNIDHEKTIRVYIESDNKFWKPMIHENDFKNNFLYPFVLVLSLAQLLYNNEDFQEKMDKNKEKNFIDIIAEIVKRYS